MSTTRYLKITIKELEALIKTADSCQAMGGELYEEANAAVKAYKAVLKRNGLTLEQERVPLLKVGNIR